MSPNTVAYYVLTLLSAVVALSGLLLDSSAIVVGSMVIAPQVGSSLGAATGIVISDRETLRDGLQAQIVGLAAAVVVERPADESFSQLPADLERAVAERTGRVPVEVEYVEQDRTRP